jgi:glycosyltransferase involved in cell wall biosynthesis
VGGTHPALIEAMGAGNLVLAFRTPENEEVLDGTGLLFSHAHELAAELGRVVADPRSSEFDDLRRAARQRVASTYSWEAITTQYEQLFQRLLRAGRRR